MKTHNRLGSVLEVAPVESPITEPTPSDDWAAFDEALAAVASARVAKNADAQTLDDAQTAAGSPTAGTRRKLRFAFRPSDGRKPGHWWSARFTPPET
jgi:hypothetical protein